MFQLELIRQITFWSLFIVSAFLSANLYIGLADNIYTKGIMVLVAVTIEGLKILCLTMANTARWQLTQLRMIHMKESMLGFFTRSKRKTIKDPELLRDVLSSTKKTRTASILYFWYVFAGFVSIGASFGFIRQTVNDTMIHNLSSTNTQTISVYQDTQAQYDASIQQNLKAIDSDNKAVDQYNKLISGLDTAATDYQRVRSTYQGNINEYQRRITALQATNADYQAKKLALNDKIQNYKVQDIQTVKDTKKTMYQLMGETLNVSDQVVMFIFLYMLAILIEVGIFICSPHFNRMDDDTLKVDFTPTSKAKKVAEPVKPTTVEEAPIFSPTPLLPSFEERSVLLKEIAEPSLEEPVVEAVEEIKLSEQPLAPIPVVAPLIDVSEGKSSVQAVVIPGPAPEIPVRDGVRVDFFEKYIDALFNSGQPYLKDKLQACDDAGIMRTVGAVRYWDYLQKEKPDGAKALIEFREDKHWYPNYPIQFIKAYIVSNFGRKRSDGT